MFWVRCNDREKELWRDNIGNWKYFWTFPLSHSEENGRRWKISFCMHSNLTIHVDRIIRFLIEIQINLSCSNCERRTEERAQNTSLKSNMKLLARHHISYLSKSRIHRVCKMLRIEFCLDSPFSSLFASLASSSLSDHVTVMKHLFHSIFQWFNVKQIHSAPDYMRLRESWFLIAFEMFYQCHIFLDVSINDCTRSILPLRIILNKEVRSEVWHGSS